MNLSSDAIAADLHLGVHDDNDWSWEVIGGGSRTYFVKEEIETYMNTTVKRFFFLEMFVLKLTAANNIDSFFS